MSSSTRINNHELHDARALVPSDEIQIMFILARKLTSLNQQQIFMASWGNIGAWNKIKKTMATDRMVQSAWANGPEAQQLWSPKTNSLVLFIRILSYAVMTLTIRSYALRLCRHTC